MLKLINVHCGVSNKHSVMALLGDVMTTTSAWAPVLHVASLPSIGMVTAHCHRRVVSLQAIDR